MKLTPILTEKSLGLAKEGFYSFATEKRYSKGRLKKEIERIFGVHVRKIKTANFKESQKRNLRGYKTRVPGYKKVIVKLAEKEKIDIFEEKGK